MNAPIVVGAGLVGPCLWLCLALGVLSLVWLGLWFRARLRCAILEDTLHSVHVAIQMARDCDVAWLDLALEEIDRVVSAKRPADTADEEETAPDVA